MISSSISSRSGVFFGSPLTGALSPFAIPIGVEATKSKEGPADEKAAAPAKGGTQAAGEGGATAKDITEVGATVTSTPLLTRLRDTRRIAQDGEVLSQFDDEDLLRYARQLRGL